MKKNNNQMSTRTELHRRQVFAMVAAVAATSGSGVAFAADETIKIAVVAPLAGAFAASGQDILEGAKLAAADINAAGGIRSIGGRMIELVPADAGQSPEAAVSAARRALNGQPVAAIGSWYSALTLAATTVAEQKRIPWLTGSIADAIVGRGFKYVYQISAGSEDSAQGLIDSILRAAGSSGIRLALMTDNNVANVDVKAFVRKKISEPLVSEQTWTPPLADATPVVSAVMQTNPNVIYLGATSTSDQTLVIKQLAAQGSKALIILGASSGANPVLLDAVGAKGMEGVLVVTGVSFPGKGTAEIDKRYAAATGRAFMDCEAMTGYMNITILGHALEKAGKAEPEALNQALKELDARDVPSLSLLPGGNRLRFQPNGRRESVTVELVQWQDGRPVVVHPPEVANGTLRRKA
jgi:branched-chain amino acid transport system substrate-binding protein